ncbi:TPA: DUF3486 family protein [Stenotrophomonas maltophilia]|nr:DUF3486 family protein [Stenotrophomonas maltophilia]HEL3849942.1 DUF3486 family protein [Stenotrophomonas maltophilia]HEL4772132.1 DUF3486 family protein [Stenotrophomonas maltophilia]
MPPASKIDQLPQDIRAELDTRLIASGFGGYVGLAEWLTEKGFSIGKSAVGAYGQKLERRLAAVKASTEAARLISQAAPDDADERSNAIISIVQTEIFDALLALQELEEGDEEGMDPGKRIALLGKAAKNIATLSRASVNRHKWATEVREKALQEASQRVEDAARARGLGADDVAFWRNTVLQGVG